MNCSSVPCSSSLPPLPREPMTRSASPARIGATRCGMSCGSCDPSASMKTTISPSASRERQAQRLALALAAVLDDARAVRGGDLARAVARMAVDDQHLVGVRLHLVDDLADQPFFVFRGDDNGDAEARAQAGAVGPATESRQYSDRCATRSNCGPARGALCYNRYICLHAAGLQGSEPLKDADPPTRPRRRDSRRQRALPGVALQGDVRRDLPLQLPLRDVQHLAEEERGRDDAGRGRPLLRSLAAVPVGPPHRRRALHAPRPRRSRRRDPEELPVAVPAELPHHRLVRRQDRRRWSSGRSRAASGA